MVQGQVRRDAPQPRGKIRFRIKSRMRFVRAPKSLHGQILRCRRIAHDAHHPAIHLALVLPEKRFKGVQIARRESLQQFHAPPPSYLYLPWISSKRYIYFCALPTVSSKAGMNMSTLRVRMVFEILRTYSRVIRGLMRGVRFAGAFYRTTCFGIRRTNCDYPSFAMETFGNCEEPNREKTQHVYPRDGRDLPRSRLYRNPFHSHAFDATASRK